MLLAPVDIASKILFALLFFNKKIMFSTSHLLITILLYDFELLMVYFILYVLTVFSVSPMPKFLSNKSEKSNIFLILYPLGMFSISFQLALVVFVSGNRVLDTSKAPGAEKK